jgi:hypothetical protein
MSDVLTAQSFGIDENRFPTEGNTHLIENTKDIFNISFFSGIVAFHIDKDLSTQPKIVRNMEKKPIKDYRYEGKRSALIEWPNIFKKISVLIHGK